jgi:hypothetical protein
MAITGREACGVVRCRDVCIIAHFGVQLLKNNSLLCEMGYSYETPCGDINVDVTVTGYMWAVFYRMRRPITETRSPFHT